MPKPLKLPRVAVLVDTSTTWGRQIATGIHKFTRRRHPWQLFIEARGTEERPSLPTGWQGDGVIARIGTLAMGKELQALRLPVVNVSAIELPGIDFPRVTNDLVTGALMAAQYFLDRGYRSFGYLSLLGLPYVVTQQEAFREAVQQGGGECAIYGVKTHEGAEPDWNLNLDLLAGWLRSLPKPVAVFTWNADSGRQVVYACQHAGLRIPEEVALLSGADDDLLCELSHIPISAMRIAAEQIGDAAAALLNRLMRGGKPPAQPQLIAPLDVVTRQSTETYAMHDETLVRAVHFIRQSASQTVLVADVARHVGVSRRMLERRFAEVLRRTPAEEIRRVHVEQAKKLLLETDLPIPDVAAASGFGSPEYMSHVFREELGQTPLRYRKDVRRR
jgi:LacI family transcriptional regulator